jgi:transcriptional regulator with XRE-family HTH domain
MNRTLERMKLREILEQRGITTIREFARLADLSRQQAWNLWHEKAGVGKAMAKKLNEKLHIPIEELIQVDPVPYPFPRKSRKASTPQRKGKDRKPRGSP